MKTQTIKSYGTASHAKRALKSIGTAALQAYDKLVTINENGRFEFILEKAEAIQEKADAGHEYDEPKALTKNDKFVAAAKAVNFADAKTLASMNTSRNEPKKEEFHKVTEAEHVAHRNETTVQGTTKVQAIVRESTVERPCKLVWHIADDMIGARRKDVLAECVRRGVAFYTARTQYQLWLSIKNGTAR
jgi:hypothetical protein